MGLMSTMLYHQDFQVQCLNNNMGSLIPSFNMSYPQIFGVNYTINPNWLSMMSELGIKYILFDKTFVTGMIQPYNYDTRALYLLENYSLISQIYHSIKVSPFLINRIS